MERRLASTLKDLPSIERLVSSEALRLWEDKVVRPVRVRLAQELVAELRARIQQGAACPPKEAIEQALEKRYEACLNSAIRRVINATGVILHTNLGRAPLGEALLGHLSEALSGYCSLEIDLGTGERGSRTATVERLLRLLTGAPAAVAVNNNAAAFFLCLHTLAKGRGALISRGELVQIGGGFRVPDILSAAGVKLIEVGTTNMTSADDFARAITSETACLLKVHQSNFVISGHTAAPSLKALSEIAEKAQLPLIVDLGSGALVDLGVGEPTVEGVLREGPALVCFSGDKLMGGPQAGLIVGEAKWVEPLRQSPLYRALRLGKLEVLALEHCLSQYIQGKVNPTARLRAISLPELNERAERVAAAVGGRVVAGGSSLGGGTTPALEIKTALVEIPQPNPERFALRLLRESPPVVVRRDKGRVLLDLRTVFADEEKALIAALRKTLGEIGSCSS